MKLQSNKEYLMEHIHNREELVDYINNCVADAKEQNPDSWGEDLHFHLFNEDYYIIGTYQAKCWLGDYVFDAINVIKEYEQDNFGEVSTDFSDPEKVVNMYAYIAGEHLLNELGIEHEG
tara:strand:- start:31 stop:387 length:357 start_codon:yes stop_codon:yes gene_type:complete